jgi:protein SCO1/2
MITMTARLASAQVTLASGGIVNTARDVGIDQKLNQTLPLDAVFKDETGRTVRLGDYFGKKPVILNMIFYKCAGSCIMESEGMVRAFKEINFSIGKEFEVVTVSINPRESPEVAASKKEGYVQAYGRPSGAAGWHFLVGDLEQINRVATATGFRFIYDQKTGQIAHATDILVCTPQGKISRYFMGVEYSPRDLRLALVEASQNRIGTLADRFILACSMFDATRSRYGLLVIRLTQWAGILTMLILGVSILVMSLRNRRRALLEPAKADGRGSLTSA